MSLMQRSTKPNTFSMTSLVYRDLLYRAGGGGSLSIEEVKLRGSEYSQSIVKAENLESEL